MQSAPSNPLRPASPQHAPASGQTEPPTPISVRSAGVARRTFVRGLGIAATLLTPSVAGLASVEARDDQGGFGKFGRFTPGDIAILRFLAAAELIETDLWAQYTELAEGNPAFGNALAQIDGDMAQYISDNTDDELSHATFLNGLLVSLGEPPVDLDLFRNLPGSLAQGSLRRPRLTNLTNLTVDTSWYLRYRSTANPDFGDVFRQFINIVGKTAIPLRDDYTQDEIQAIANTAAFHFASIEQGGSSLYASFVPKATHLDVLQVLAGIGGSEVNHFAIWHDKAGDVPAVTVGNLVFPDLSVFDGDPTRQKNLIMPEPCHFLRPNLPLCSVIRPASTAKAGAVAAIAGFTQSGLFAGQTQAFFRKINALAQAADAARRGEIF